MMYLLFLFLLFRLFLFLENATKDLLMSNVLMQEASDDAVCANDPRCDYLDFDPLLLIFFTTFIGFLTSYLNKLNHKFTA